jgi:predicted DCC family thiol-disulfide oxidoreductase YuxK
MSAPVAAPPPETRAPTLLFDDECGVCRGIAAWVRGAARGPGDAAYLDVRPIGEDPEALRAIAPALDIWDAYDTIHLVMPDGSMKLGGEAVAEVLRRLPSTRWFAWCFSLGVFGWQPCQQLLDLAYTILAALRPVFGCESCGTPSPWIKPLVWLADRFKAMAARRPASSRAGHFTPRDPSAPRPR